MPLAIPDPDSAVKKFQSLAWQGKWNDAIGEIGSLASEHPDGRADIHYLFGLGYQNTGRFDDALVQFEAVLSLFPNSVIALDKIAQLRKKTGDLSACKKALWSIIGIYDSLGDIEHSQNILLRIIETAPEDIDARLKLASLFADTGKGARAAAEYVTITRLAAGDNDIDRALEYVKRACQLDETNSEAKALLDRLQRFEKQSAEGISSEDLIANGASDLNLDWAMDSLLQVEGQTDKGHLEGFGDLLEGFDHVVGAGQELVDDEETKQLLLAAQGFEEQDRFDAAIACYQELIQGGAEGSNILFGLGRVYWKSGNFHDALRMLNMVADVEPNRALARIIMGLCQTSLGQNDAAIEYLKGGISFYMEEDVETKSLDIFLAGVLSLAGMLGRSARAAEAASLLNSAIRFMIGRGEGSSVEALQQQLTSVTIAAAKTGSLGDEIPDGFEATIGEAVAKSRDYLDKELFIAAIDECLLGIASCPGYLPLHIRLAEIYSAMALTADAINKFQLIADVYLVRGAIHGAIEMYEKVMELNPGDMAVASRLNYLKQEQGKTRLLD